MITPEEHVPLGPRTTLQVGGPARYLFEADTEAEVTEALGWARDHALAVEVLGGGSNVLIGDRGLNALVVRPRMQHITRDGDLVDVGAGVGWDDLVAYAVREGLAGLECLSGIPGDVGAAPMQNVGAYGQEVSQTIVEVRAIVRASGDTVTLDNSACDFGYRDSTFKREAAGKYIVTAVRFRLVPSGAPTIAYPELERAVKEQRGSLDLDGVRDTVIALRRRKSMVLDPTDENHRSAGSFFVNVSLPHDAVEALRLRVRDRLGPDVEVPTFPSTEGHRKVPAAWLIERAGFAKGTTRGRVGISTRHSLALVNRGGATAAELVAFAADVRAGVREAFGITLTPEPRLLGFGPGELEGLVP